ncbi:MAG: hypothetical protein AMJ93_11705 [Anaerolineae bacterium SM23_84]|nr:MAG: hypothetical protein AMJ93_11705 [Anaerolineae bacterium SM23_84]
MRKTVLRHGTVLALLFAIATTLACNRPPEETLEIPTDVQASPSPTVLPTPSPTATSSLLVRGDPKELAFTGLAHGAMPS